MIAFIYPMPRWLLRGAMAFAVLSLALMVLQLVGEQGQRLSMKAMILPFLMAFACFKWALARETQLILRAGGAPAAELVVHHGTAAGVRQWIAYKYAATIMALIASLVIAVLLLRS